MKIPKLIYSDRFLDRIGLFMKIGGITLYPFIILREKHKDNYLINTHERIHIEQQRELFVVFFYLIYILEFLIKSLLWLSFKDAYYKISFEREAYANQYDINYIEHRNKYAWLGFILNKKE